MTPYRVAIIGTGGIARAHVAAWRSVQDEVLPVAAVDIAFDRLQAFASEFDIPHVYTDAATMLAEQAPDLVHICTPPSLHTDLIVACLQAGAHVLCEKPLCGSLQELDRIAETEKASGCVCASVVQWRFGSAVRHLKPLIEQGSLGEHTLTICATTWYRDDAYYDVPWRGTWASELGGVSTGQAIHLIDLMLFLNTPWREVRAQTKTLKRQMEVEDLALAMVTFDDGSLGSVINSVLSPAQETRLRLDFTGGTAEVTGLYGYDNAGWTVTPIDGTTLPDGLWPPAENTSANHATQLQVMIAALRANERPPAGVDDIRGTIEFLTALYKSGANGGECVSRGSIGPEDAFYRHIGGHPSTS